jgi:hypothetical protein
MAHWRILEFTFYSISTCVLRLNPNLVNDSFVREECISSARKALVSFKELQAQLLGPDDLAGLYQFYVSW